MTAFVVDTNVAIVANGRGTDVAARCKLTCLERLRTLTAQGIVAIDDKGLILDEYRRQLNLSGRPGVGDAFLKHLFDNQYRDTRVQRVAVTPSEDDRRGFVELPENAFDRSDRKFLAVAIVAGAVVMNATDSDWNEHEALMVRLGVRVAQLCPEHATKGARRD